MKATFKIIKNKTTYSLPIYKCDDEGIKETGEELEIPFVSKIEGKEGIVTESLLLMQARHLEELNVGDFENEFTTKAIEHIKEAVKLIIARREDRQNRGVFGKLEK